MKLIGRFSCILLLGLLPLVAACPQTGQPDREIQAVAEPLLDTQLQGISQDNYDLYVKNYDAPVQLMLDKEKFTKIKEQVVGKLGQYKSRAYLGFMTKGKDTQVLWKAKFEKSDDDILIRLVFSKKNGKNLIKGLYFQ